MIARIYPSGGAGSAGGEEARVVLIEFVSFSFR